MLGAPASTFCSANPAEWRCTAAILDWEGYINFRVRKVGTDGRASTQFNLKLAIAAYENCSGVCNIQHIASFRRIHRICKAITCISQARHGKATVRSVTGVTYKNVTNLYNTTKPLTKPCTTLMIHCHQIVQSGKNIKSRFINNILNVQGCTILYQHCTIQLENVVQHQDK